MARGKVKNPERLKRRMLRLMRPGAPGHIPRILSLWPKKGEFKDMKPDGKLLKAAVSQRDSNARPSNWSLQECVDKLFLLALSAQEEAESDSSGSVSRIRPSPFELF